MLTALLVAMALSDITPEQAAQMQADQAKQMELVDKQFGNKKSTELSSTERRDMIRARGEAEQKALEKNGLSAKEWARYSQTLNRQNATEAKAATEKLKADEALTKKAADAAAEAKAKAAAAVEIVGQERPAEPGNETDVTVLPPTDPNSAPAATSRSRSSTRRRR